MQNRPSDMPSGTDADSSASLSAKDFAPEGIVGINNAMSFPRNETDASIRENLSIRIEELRYKLKITKLAFSRLTGVHRFTYDYIVDKKGLPSILNLLKISESTGVTIHWLLGLDESGKWEINAPKQKTST